MPLKVAVAGVTSGLGHAIVSALLDIRDVDITLLTRSSSSGATDLSHFTTRGAKLIPVDYASIPELTTAISGVRTIICTISPWPTSPLPVLNLIEASKLAGVQRFAPAEFSYSLKATARLVLNDAKENVRKALKERGIEYTVFTNGVFMNYLAFGAKRKHEGPFKLFPFIVDIGSRKAVIPGTGDEEISLTTVEDVGKFVAFAVTKFEGRWPEELGMEGERISYNRVMEIVEGVTGEKVERVYVGREELGEAIEDAKGRGDEMGMMVNQAMEVIVDGFAIVEPYLNRLAGSEVRVTGVQGFLERYWKV